MNKKSYDFVYRLKFGNTNSKSVIMNLRGYVSENKGIGDLRLIFKNIKSPNPIIK